MPRNFFAPSYKKIDGTWYSKLGEFTQKSKALKYAEKIRKEDKASVRIRASTPRVYDVQTFASNMATRKRRAYSVYKRQP